MNIDWQKLYGQVSDWVIVHGPSILLAVAIFVAGIFFIRLVNKWIRKGMERRHVSASVKYFLQNLFAITMQILLTVLCLQIAGFELTVFSAILAGLTVAAGLALSGTLQNFVSGILILFLKPYRVGDNINTQGLEGTVTSIQLFYTVVLTYDNKTIIVPNGQLSNSVVVNLSREGKRRLDIDMDFDYATEINAVKNILLKSMADAKEVLLEPSVRVGVSTLKTDRYTITINAWTKAHGFYDTKIAVNEKIVSDLKAGGVELPEMKL